MNAGTTIFDDEQEDEPRPVGEILKELLAQYEARFPSIHVTVVETAANVL